MIKLRAKFRSTETIEYSANVLRYQLKEHLKTAQSIGFEGEQYLDYLVYSEKLSTFDFTESEGLSDEILGKYIFNSNEILIYNGIKNKARENFTIFHEIGHCILHRLDHYYEHRSNEYRIEFPPIALVLKRDVLSENKQTDINLNVFEKQANIFARMLSMPKLEFSQLFYETMKFLKLNSNSFINLSMNQANNVNNYMIVSDVLMTKFRTSRAATGVRLKELGFLNANFAFNVID